MQGKGGCTQAGGVGGGGEVKVYPLNVWDGESTVLYGHARCGSPRNSGGVEGVWVRDTICAPSGMPLRPGDIRPMCGDRGAANQWYAERDLGGA